MKDLNESRRLLVDNLIKERTKINRSNTINDIKDNYEDTIVFYDYQGNILVS